MIQWLSVMPYEHKHKLLGRLVEFLDHLFGDVNLRAHPDGVLNNQVKLLLLGNVLDNAIGTLQDDLALFVGTLVTFFNESTLTTSNVTFGLGKRLALLETFTVSHHRAILLKLLRTRAEVANVTVEFVFTLLEVSLELT